MDISTILQNPEGKTLEFKQDLSSHEGVLRSLIAFANTSGGTLVIGIEDKTKNVIGVNDPLAMEERLANIINDGISPRLVPNIEILPWRSTYLVLVQVYPSNNRPHYLKNKGLEKGTYIRIGSTNRTADTIIINELQRITKLEAYDELPMPDLDSEAIDFRVASELFSEYRKLTKANLETLKIVTKNQGRLVPTIGGVLLFGKNREEYFPDAWIQAGRFIGTNKKDILDSQEIHAYPVIAIEEAINFIKKHFMQALEISGTRRHEQWNIPLIAIREAIINAVVHADYAQRGAPIRIAIFDDRIEIENPGLIPFNLTLEDLYKGISKLRNPVMGRVFHELKLIERWGSGIRRMVETCLETGFEKPLLEEIGIHFRVTIFTKRKRSKSFTKLEKTDQNILEFLKINEGLSTQQIANKIGRTTRSTRSRLIALVERGLVVEVGTSPQDPKRKYFMAKINLGKN
jgi:predicted HTH transcriptional regulator